MIKPYKDRYPTIKDLHKLYEADSRRYHCGTGNNIDSREYFKNEFYETLEPVIVDELLKQYPDMTVIDAVVCREVYTNIELISGGEYVHIKERLHVYGLYTLLRDLWPRYFFENKSRVLKEDIATSRCNTLDQAEELVQEMLGRCNDRPEIIADLESFPLLGLEQDRETAIQQTCARGYISYEFVQEAQQREYYNNNNNNNNNKQSLQLATPIVKVKLRPDVHDTIARAIASECARTDAAIRSNPKDAAEMDRLNELYHQRLERERENGRGPC